MEPYKNLFKEKTESELTLLYKQFLDFEKTGVISSDVELGKIRDQYCVWFDSGSPLVALERDLLHTIADIWYNQQTNAIGLRKSIGEKVIIRQDLKMDERYGWHIASEEMVEFAGKRRL